MVMVPFDVKSLGSTISILPELFTTMYARSLMYVMLCNTSPNGAPFADRKISVFNESVFLFKKSILALPWLKAPSQRINVPLPLKLVSVGLSGSSFLQPVKISGTIRAATHTGRHVFIFFMLLFCVL